jgi:hypothetical protein
VKKWCVASSKKIVGAALAAITPYRVNLMNHLSRMENIMVLMNGFIKTTLARIYHAR